MWEQAARNLQCARTATYSAVARLPGVRASLEKTMMAAKLHGLVEECVVIGASVHHRLHAATTSTSLRHIYGLSSCPGLGMGRRRLHAARASGLCDWLALYPDV
mmetsp:Transcript_3404/g.9616  ORF Transcript_3404/g.9616 Transcript_3404/m.9616 type:complete len:104 (-) Transcript_3404:590-901(-)